MEMITENDAYVSLFAALAGQFERSLSDLAGDLREKVVTAFYPLEWDRLSAEQRQSVAAKYDFKHDPEREPALYFELLGLREELERDIASAVAKDKDSAALALTSVLNRIDGVLNTDRARVGASIQSLRRLQGQPASPEPDIDPSDYPKELDAALMAFRAVRNGYPRGSTDTYTFKRRIETYLEEHYPSLPASAKDRIATVANADNAPGRRAKV
jgi:hypothetical protein